MSGVPAPAVPHWYADAHTSYLAHVYDTVDGRPRDPTSPRRSRTAGGCRRRPAGPSGRPGLARDSRLPRRGRGGRATPAAPAAASRRLVTAAVGADVAAVLASPSAGGAATTRVPPSPASPGRLAVPHALGGGRAAARAWRRPRRSAAHGRPGSPGDGRGRHGPAGGHRCRDGADRRRGVGDRARPPVGGAAPAPGAPPLTTGTGPCWRRCRWSDPARCPAAVTRVRMKTMRSPFLPEMRAQSSGFVVFGRSSFSLNSSTHAVAGAPPAGPAAVSSEVA